MNSIVDAIQAIKANKIVIVIDNQDRENEGDLIMAADEISSEQMAFFIKHTSGLICCPMPESRVHELNLGMMVIDNSDLHQTAFTVSVDYKTNSTGISAVDRSSTARALANVESKPSDFRRPGHMFPLKSRDLKSRQGHTEAAVCLCLLAGKSGVGVISEIVSVKNPCLMATRQELLEMSKEWEMGLMSKMSKTAIALFDCVSDSLSELTFKENDLITNVTETQEDGWFHGVLIRTGQSGLFPCNYVKFTINDSQSFDKKAARQDMKSRSDQIVADALAKHSNITRSNSGNLNEKVTLVPTVLHAFPARVGPALPARPLVNNVNSNGPFSDTSIMSDTTYSPRIPDRPHTSFENISDDPFTRVSTTRSQSTSAPFSYIQNQKTSSLILEKPHNYTIPASNQAPSLPSRSSIQQRFEKIEITDQNSKTKLPPPRPSKPAQLSTQSSTPISNEGNEIPSKKRPPPVPPSKSNPYNLDRYKQLFHQADSLKCGLLTALQVRSIWLKSGLGNKQLASIWKMVDIEPDHCLRIDKFCLGMYMIDQELGKLI